MHFKVFENVFDKKVLAEILEYFETSSDVVLHNGMEKLENPWLLPIIQDKIKPVLSKYFDTTLENLGDNIYKHNHPYFPHVDTSKTYPCFNVLIPIKVDRDLPQKFCIFDQYVNRFESGYTWVGNLYQFIKDFDYNKKRKFVYNDDIVVNPEVEQLDNDFFENYLQSKTFSKDLFKGLNGVAIDFKPGNLIVFDSKYIHCTGKFHGNWKVGLSLRFKGNFTHQIQSL